MADRIVVLTYLVALLCAVTAAVCDIRTSKVPNLLTLPSMFCGLLMHLISGGWDGVGSAALAGLIAGGVFLVFHIAGGMGAGDVKLITAIGCFAGLPQIGYLLFFVAITGGFMAVAVTLYRRRVRETILNLGALLLHHRTSGLRPHPALNLSNAHTLRLPYAVPIAVGCALSFGLNVVQR
jgi:prepilin peptidase CpaA